MIWFEDIEIGTKRDLGTYTFTEDEIIAFAKKYDPQIFHIDAQAAKKTMFGGLIASGWHTAAVWMKLAIADRERARREGKTLGRSGVSPGFEDMRWIKPIRPGMTLRYTSETIEKTELQVAQGHRPRQKPQRRLRRKRRTGVQLHRQRLRAAKACRLNRPQFHWRAVEMTQIGDAEGADQVTCALTHSLRDAAGEDLIRFALETPLRPLRILCVLSVKYFFPAPLKRDLFLWLSVRGRCKVRTE